MEENLDKLEATIRGEYSGSLKVSRQVLCSVIWTSEDRHDVGILDDYLDYTIEYYKNAITRGLQNSIPSKFF